jgi:cell division topological specificity factor
MQEFFDRLLGRKPRSAQVAADRLRFVLVSDRSDLSPEQLNQMQAEIIEVIKKYCRVVEHDVDIKLEQRARENYLVADIPIARDDKKEGGRISFSLQTTPADEKPNSDTKEKTAGSENLETE